MVGGCVNSYCLGPTDVAGKFLPKTWGAKSGKTGPKHYFFLFALHQSLLKTVVLNKVYFNSICYVFDML